MKKTSFLTLAPAALAALFALQLTGCSHPAEEPAATPVPVVAEREIRFPGAGDPIGVRTEVVGVDAAQTLSVNGRLAWDEDQTTRVFAPYAGRIERLRATVGQRVRRGEALADVTSSDIGQAQADLHKAQADQALARAALERARELVEGGVIARKDLQQAEADFARSNAESTRAQARLSTYGVAARGITQSMALAAPLAGVVVERNGNPGMEVRADVQGAPLFTISDPTRLWATLDVDETLLAAFQPGRPLQLQVAAWPEVRFPGTVLWIGEAVDPVTRTVKVRAEVPNPDRRLKAEMFVTASVEVPSTLPEVGADAVFLRGQQSSLFVQRGPGVYERRDVQVRPSGPQKLRVTSGVAVGERVVTSGGLYLNQLMDATR